MVLEGKPDGRQTITSSGGMTLFQIKVQKLMGMGMELGILVRRCNKAAQQSYADYCSQHE